MKNITNLYLKKSILESALEIKLDKKKESLIEKNKNKDVIKS
jgi:hypothetical protein